MTKILLPIDGLNNWREECKWETIGFRIIFFNLKYIQLLSYFNTLCSLVSSNKLGKLVLFNNSMVFEVQLIDKTRAGFLALCNLLLCSNNWRYEFCYFIFIYVKCIIGFAYCSRWRTPGGERIESSSSKPTSSSFPTLPNHELEMSHASYLYLCTVLFDIVVHVSRSH